MTAFSTTKQKDGTLRHAALTAAFTLAADGPLCRVWFFPFSTLAFYISWLQLFDKILRAILSVVKSDGSIRGRGLKALALIVDSDPSLLADVRSNLVTMLRCAVMISYSHV